MSELFAPITINRMTLKNRVVMLPMVLGMSVAGPQARAFYMERARGGVGAITTSATLVDMFLHDSFMGHQNTVADFLASLRLLVDSVHEAGAKIGMQLIQSSRYVDRSLSYGSSAAQNERVGPSDGIEPDPAIHPMGAGLKWRAMDVAEISQIVANFGRAAEHVREVGFDYIEVHAAHGNLMCQFFSPVDNRRQDEYGRDLAGRMRFGLECVRQIRSSVGKDFPVFFRIAAADDRPGGITLADSTAYAVELQKAGVDCFNVSVGTSIDQPYWRYASPGKRDPFGTYADLAEAIKRVVNVPVIAVGRNNTPEVAQTILARGKADLIGIGRQLIADPLWPNKVKEGRGAEIVACKSCNKNCWAPLGYVKVRPGSSLCKLNPRAGKEWEQQESNVQASPGSGG